MPDEGRGRFRAESKGGTTGLLWVYDTESPSVESLCRPDPAPGFGALSLGPTQSH